MKPLKYISVEEIIERALDIFDSEDIDYSVLVRHVSDGLLLIGTFDQMIEDVIKIKVHNYRAEIPCNILSIEQIRDCETKTPINYSSNTFHMSKDDKNNKNNVVQRSDTYIINRDYIIVDFPEGELEVAVTKFPVDERGFPVIPDKIEFKKALESYLIERIGYRLYLKDRIDDRKYAKMEQERNWYMGAAESIGKMPSPDQMEIIKNGFIRMLELPLSRNKFHTDLNEQEKLRVRPQLRRF